MGAKLTIHKGDRYGRLTIVKEVEPFVRKDGTIRRQFLCFCDCGVTKVCKLDSLRCGGTKSCGCLALELKTKHGMNKGKGRRSKIYSVWSGMKDRTGNPNNSGYPLYGGRGITCCKRWMDFKNFKEDMLPTYREGLTLDRINNDKGYSKNNCRWVTMKENLRNTRANINHEGKCLAEWAKILGVKDNALRWRCRRYGVPFAIDYYRIKNA